MVSTLLLVTGAMLLGQSLHGSVVTGEYALTSPWAVLRAAAGLVCIALGYRFRTPASEYASLPSDDSGGEPSGDGGSERGDGDFDPELSPLSDEQFENLESVDDE